MPNPTEQPHPECLESPIKDLILSDPYWEGEHLNPFFVGMKAHEIEGIDGGKNAVSMDTVRIAFDHESAREIARSAVAAYAGTTRFAIAEGVDVPTPSSNSRQVAKIVEDRRTIISNRAFFYSPLPNMVSKRSLWATLEAVEVFNPNYFDKQAHQIESLAVPLGLSARAFMAYDKNNMVMLERRVFYSRAGAGRHYGTSVDGIHIGRPDSKAYAEPLPHLSVGAIYKGTLKNQLRRIVSAELLEPNSTQWKRRKAPGRPAKEQVARNGRFALRPQLALDR